MSQRFNKLPGYVSNFPTFPCQIFDKEAIIYWNHGAYLPVSWHDSYFEEIWIGDFTDKSSLRLKKEKPGEA